MLNQKKKKSKSLKHLNSYAKYTGLVFQMAFIIGAGTYGGVFIDEKLEKEFPLFTVILSLLSVFAALYLVIKQVMNEKD